MTDDLLRVAEEMRNRAGENAIPGVLWAADVKQTVEWAARIEVFWSPERQAFHEAALEYCVANALCDEYLSNDKQEAGEQFAERIEAYQAAHRHLEDAYRALRASEERK